MLRPGRGVTGRGLPDATLAVVFHPGRNGVSGCRAVVSFGDPEAQVEAGGEPRSGDPVPVFDDPFVDDLPDVGAQVVVSAVVGGGVSVGEQPGGGEQQGAGAGRGDPGQIGRKLGHRVGQPPPLRLRPGPFGGMIPPATAGHDHPVWAAECGLGEQLQSAGGCDGPWPIQADELNVEAGRQDLERPESVDLVEAVVQQDLDAHAPMVTAETSRDQWQGCPVREESAKPAHLVAVIAPPGVVAFDLTIATQVFGHGDPGRYDVTVCGVASGRVSTTSDFELDIKADLSAVTGADTLLSAASLAAQPRRSSCTP